MWEGEMSRGVVPAVVCIIGDAVCNGRLPPHLMHMHMYGYVSGIYCADLHDCGSVHRWCQMLPTPTAKEHFTP